MKRYINAELLRKEIESRMGDCDANSKNPNQLLWAELAALLPFIDSLQQEQSCDTCTNDKGCVTCKDGELWEGKEQQNEKMKANTLEELIEYLSKRFDVSYAKLARIVVKTAKWQKQQMLKEAVEGEVYRYDGYQKTATAIIVGIPSESFGDKVKIVIMKED